MQISSDFNNFWQIDGDMSEILCGVFTFHLNWPVLPVTIRNAQTQARFKKLLKTFLFTQFYSCC